MGCNNSTAKEEPTNTAPATAQQQQQEEPQQQHAEEPWEGGPKQAVLVPEHRAMEAAVVATALARGEAQGASRKAQGTVLRIVGGHGGPRHHEQSRLPCFAAVRV